MHRGGTHPASLGGDLGLDPLAATPADDRVGCPLLTLRLRDRGSQRRIPRAAPHSR